MTKVKKTDEMSTPVPQRLAEYETLSSVYPIGFGITKDGKANLFLYGKDGEVVEFEITPTTLMKIAEMAEETLNNLGRKMLGVPVK